MEQESDLNEVNKMIGNEVSFNFILKKIKNNEIKVNEFTILIFAMKWDFYEKDKYVKLYGVKDSIKKLISYGAELDRYAKSGIKRFIEMSDEEILSLENFNKQHKEFVASSLKSVCIKFFKEKNIDVSNINIPTELREMIQTLKK